MEKSVRSKERSQENLPPAAKASPISTRFYRKGMEAEERAQWVVQEKPVTLYLNGREMVTLLCAGHHLDELAVGFFHAEGFLDALEDLENVAVDEESGKVEVTTRVEFSVTNRLWQKRTVTSGCGKGTLFYYALDDLLSEPVESSLQISPSQVWERMEDLTRLSETYRHTHGVHNTALATAREIVLFRDDIGRHNAIDMIVGHAFLNGVSMDDKLFLTTGRLTSEILIKAAKVGISVLVSRNTATSLAVELSRTLNITLIGYVRGGQFTVYSGTERLLDSRSRE